MKNLKSVAKGYAAKIALSVGFAIFAGSVAVAYSGGAKQVCEAGAVCNVNEAASNDGLVGSASVSNVPAPSSFSEIALIDPTYQKKMSQGFAYSDMPATGDTTTTAFITNSTGQTVYLDLNRFVFQYAGTTSSTVDTTCATSTKTGIASYTTTIVNGFLQAYRSATSTVNSNDLGLGVSTSTRKLATLANGESVICGWASPVSNGCTGAFCEAVTSTNRGYTAQFFVPYFYFRAP